MTAKAFVDTNIFIYALTESQQNDEKGKRTAAVTLLEKLLGLQEIVVSSQVLNEVHSNLVKKFKLDDSVAFQVVEQSILPISSVSPVSYHTYNQAYHLRAKYSLSYWDSLIISSSLENNCSELYSEDMQHGQIFEGGLKVINPFRS